MSDRTPIHYSAAEIERYFSGTMSPGDMHAMEKAALDDPFLADAMEGYSIEPDKSLKDMSGLEKKLDERIEQSKKSKVIPLLRSSRTWLRVAVLIIIVAGLGAIAYQFAFSHRSNDVASAKEVRSSPSNTAIDSSNVKSKADTTSQHSEIHKKAPGASDLATERVDEQNENLRKKPSSYPVTDTPETGDAVFKQLKPAGTAAKKMKQMIPGIRMKANEERANTSANVSPFETRDSNASSLAENNAAPASNAKKTGELINKNSDKADKATKATFRGQVVDANSNPLPFANVTNVADNIGTYTDAKGFFTLLARDSILTVQVRSVGFEDRLATLKPGGIRDTVVLQARDMPSTVISNQQINRDRSRRQILAVEEPEPSDGWYNYDTYLANNISVPDEIKTKKGHPGEVELSFTINKNGEPVNIVVEKSVCKECDAEAIRLLQEGPKWKKKRKNARARVSVAF